MQTTVTANKKQWTVVSDITQIQENTQSKQWGTVYAVEYGENIKIGFTKDLVKRVKNFIHQTKYSKIQINKIAFTPYHSNFTQNENILHTHFKSFRAKGTELFAITLTEFLEKAPILQLEKVVVGYQEEVKDLVEIVEQQKKGKFSNAELIQIDENVTLPTREYKGQRVVTLKDIDFIHERPKGTARRNFNQQKNRFIEGIDYFKIEITNDIIRTQFGVGKNAGRELNLITEMGYLLLVKSLTDDKSWIIQRMLVVKYFTKPNQDSETLAVIENLVKNKENIDMGKINDMIIETSFNETQNVLAEKTAKSNPPSDNHTERGETQINANNENHNEPLISRIKSTEFINSIVAENDEKVNRFCCNLDKISYNYKAKDEISKIVTRLKNKNSVVTLNAVELAKAVTNGYCFTTAQLHGKTEKDFISQQLLVVDIDNEENDLPIMSVNDAINILAENDIYYSFMYYSFSHTEEKPKFRIVCVLKEPITDPNTAKAVNKYFISLFPQADKSCHNLDRFYFGTNKGFATEVFYTTTTLPNFVPLIESKSDKQTAPPSADNDIKAPKVPTPLTAQSEQQKVEKSEVKQVEKEGKEGYFDLTQEIKNFNLLAYVEQTTGTKGIKHGKDILFNPCPICGHNDNFFIDTKRNLYKCHSNRNGTGGNIINYLMQINDWEIKTAREYFIYDIMKQDKDKSKIQYRQSKLIENIKNQQKTMPKIAELDFDEEYLPEYLYYDSKGKIKVHCAFLENYIKTHAHYIFVSDSAKETTQRYFYINGCYRLVSDEWIKSYIKTFIPLSLQKPKDVNETFALFVMSMDIKRREEINADENIINFQNGILHLDTMQLTPHNPKYLCTIQIPCNFIKDAPKPKKEHFEKYINHLTENDKSKRSLILQFLGMSISNVKGYRPKKALFMVGEHDTGKSQIRSLAAHLVGSENNSGIDLEQLESRFGTSVIYGKRLVGSDDMSYLTISELKAFKILTGAGHINAEFKGENAFTYKFDGVLWFCCNKLPKFGGDKGDGVYNRIAVIECNNPVKEKDRQLLDKLLTEREYIVSLAIKELQKVIENNYEYIIPESSEMAKEQYKINNNSFLQFFEECAEPRPMGKISDNCTTKRLYDVYVAWCADNNNKHAETKQAVTKLLKDMGKDGKKIVDGNHYWSEFTLKLGTKKDYKKVYGYDSMGL